jgi:protease-4
MAKTTELPAGTQRLVIEHTTSRGKSWLVWLLVIALLLSLGWNAWLYSSNRRYYGKLTPPTELFHSGDQTATERIALLRISGTISPPFTGRLLRQIKKAHEDDNVKGAILVVDSPGGFVADSHQIYHKLQALAADKPVYVSFKRIAASGGYYIAMGAGTKAKIFAEPTTWTGSIGVIIPRYNLSAIAKEYGVAVEPLTTGKYKDTMSPFRDMREDEKELWGEIIGDAFDRFVGVIADNRPTLDREKLKELATGQIFTANQAKANGLVDEIGFLEDVVDSLKSEIGLTEARVVSYYTPPSILETVTGYTKAEAHPLNRLMDASVPRAMYLFSWKPIPDEYVRDE